MTYYKKRNYGGIQYEAECPKCKQIYRGNEYYFRYDIKEKCFDGITKLVNYRLANKR
jgi:hypothetical protein